VFLPNIIQRLRRSWLIRFSVSLCVYTAWLERYRHAFYCLVVVFNQIVSSCKNYYKAFVPVTDKIEARGLVVYVKEIDVSQNVQ